MARRAEDLKIWQNALSDRELRLESGEDSVSGLMKELRIKDMQLGDKDLELRRKDLELEDTLRQAKEDVMREVEVCCCLLCWYFCCCVVQDYKQMYGWAKGTFDDGWQVCCCVVVDVLC